MSVRVYVGKFIFKLRFKEVKSVMVWGESFQNFLKSLVVLGKKYLSEWNILPANYTRKECTRFVPVNVRVRNVACQNISRGSSDILEREISSVGKRC